MDQRWSSDGDAMEQHRIYDLVSSLKLRSEKQGKNCIIKSFLLLLQPITRNTHKLSKL